MGENNNMLMSAVSGMVAEIKTVLESARRNVARQVNSELLNANWNIGRCSGSAEKAFCRT